MPDIRRPWKEPWIDGEGLRSYVNLIVGYIYVVLCITEAALMRLRLSVLFDCFGKVMLVDWYKVLIHGPGVCIGR